MSKRDEEASRAVDKFEQFHRFGPKKIVELEGLVIPKRLRKLGDGAWVTYRSGKVDPATLKKPRAPVDYIHEFNAGVCVYVADGRLDVDVPKQFVEAKALVHLGQCLGFSTTDGTEAESRSPMPTLAATPDGKCLMVVQSGREVLAMIWGGNLGVHPRGIDG